MCGIFGGISSVLSQSEIDDIKTLGAISYPRGDDSTGLICGHFHKSKDKNITFTVEKQVCDPYGFLYSPRVTAMLKGFNRPRVIIGHNRSATIGDVTVNNAHPFEFSNVIGVHNGTCHSLNSNDGRTDSEALYEYLNEHTIQETVDMLGDNAAYALVWVDKRDQTLHILRNSARPLYTMTTSAGGTMYFASEAIFLKYIDIRSSIVYNQPEMVPVNTHIVWDLKRGDLKPVLVEEITPPKKEEKPSPNFFQALSSPTSTRETMKDHHGTQDGATKIARLGTEFVFRMVDRVNIPSNVTPMSIDPINVYNFREDIPRNLTIDFDNNNSHVIKVLRFKGYKTRWIGSSSAEYLLNRGCLYSKQVPQLNEKIFWINEEEFVKKGYEEDAFLYEYMKENEPNWKPTEGGWYYVPQTLIKKAG